jgi:multidrug efflux pump subunit AcrA (membrane-fusion protein)
MFRKYALPLLAATLLLFAVLHVVRAHSAAPKSEPPVPPGRAAFARSVAGVGVVEAQTGNIAIGSSLSGLVAEVPVRVGQRVKAGAVLVRLDDRALKAELKVRQASLASAQAQLDRLESMPRDEEIPAAEARLREAQANLHRRSASTPSAGTSTPAGPPPTRTWRSASRPARPPASRWRGPGRS